MRIAPVNIRPVTRPSGAKAAIVVCDLCTWSWSGSDAVDFGAAHGTLAHEVGCKEPRCGTGFGDVNTTATQVQMIRTLQLKHKAPILHISLPDATPVLLAVLFIGKVDIHSVYPGSSPVTVNNPSLYSVSAYETLIPAVHCVVTIVA
jgi:hypothetical protein